MRGRETVVLFGREVGAVSPKGRPETAQRNLVSLTASGVFAVSGYRIHMLRPIRSIGHLLFRFLDARKARADRVPA